MYVMILVIVSDMVLPCQGVVFYQFSWLIILMLTYHCLCCFPCLFSYLICHLISTYPLLSVLILLSVRTVSYLCIFSYLSIQPHICAYSLISVILSYQHIYSLLQCIYKYVPVLLYPVYIHSYLVHISLILHIHLSVGILSCLHILSFQYIYSVITTYTLVSIHILSYQYIYSITNTYTLLSMHILSHQNITLFTQSWLNRRTRGTFGQALFFFHH